MERTTLNQLNMLLKRINVAAGYGELPKYSTPGSYGLDGAYGGWKLVQYVNDKGGERNITHGFVSKCECYDLMYAYLSGMQARLEAGACNA